jgi:hypothetical protein
VSALAARATDPWAGIPVRAETADLAQTARVVADQARDDAKAVSRRGVGQPLYPHPERRDLGPG